MLNIVAPDAAPVFGEQPIRIGEDAGQNGAGILPFINQLLQNAGVRMLRDKGGSQHFKALLSDLFHNRRIIEKPPASEGHQVTEFSRTDAKFMLVFAAENTYQESIVGKSPA